MKYKFTLVLMLAFLGHGFSQFEVRLTEPGGEDGLFRVQFRCTNPAFLPTTANQCTDLSFRLWWNNPQIIDIDVIQAETYGGNLNETNPMPGNSNGASGMAGTVASIGFCSACNPFDIPQNWVLNQWINVATVYICSSANCSPAGFPAGITAADFLIQGPFQGFPNIGIDFVDVTPVYNTILPLELGVFSAQKFGDRDAKITWTTINEENTSHFMVERSTDKFNWQPIADVDAAGTSTEPLHYSFDDIGVFNGFDRQFRVYYRLNMFDLDGTSRFSPIESVGFGSPDLGAGSLIVYPNPAKEFVVVEWNLANISQPTHLEVFDIVGKQIHSQEIADNSNQERIEFARIGIQSGLYLVRLLKGDEVLSTSQIIIGQN